MLQIIDTRREYIKLQLSNKKSIDYTLYPEYSLTYFLFFLSKSSGFILYDDIEMLHTMTDYILFLLDSLLLRCDTTIGLFYKNLLRSIKSSEDATILLDKEEKLHANKKLYILVDLTYVILSQRASSLMICRANSNVSLPEKYFKKSRYNHLSYLPKDFQIKLQPIKISEILSNKKRISENNEDDNKEQNSPNKKKKNSSKEKTKFFNNQND